MYYLLKMEKLKLVIIKLNKMFINQTFLLLKFNKKILIKGKIKFIFINKNNILIIIFIKWPIQQNKKN